MTISEMPKILLIPGVIVLMLAISGGMYFLVYKGIDDQNIQDQAALDARKSEIAKLQRYENDLISLNREIEGLKQQLEIQKNIVPDEQQADQFMHVMQNTAHSAGIEIRRWTAKPTVAKEYYTEVPFDLELDGPYYSLLQYFDRVSRLERIINISNLQITAIGGKELSRKYQYAPQETVVMLCTSTTFYSKESQAAPAQPKKK